MSGEYYCIEEVDPSYYCGDFDSKSNRSSNAGRRNHDNDARSTTSRKSQDMRLYEIEEQLEVAENRCNTLKGQLDSMKKIYHRSDKSGPVSRKFEVTRSKNDISENTFVRKTSRKRPNSPPVYQRSRPCSPTKKRTAAQRHYESSDSIPQKSSSSSTAVIRTTVPLIRQKEPLVRQNPTYIGTDHSGAAVKTINKILTGITDSVNRISKLHMHNNEKPKKRIKDPCVGGSDVGTTVLSVPIRSFTPLAEKRYFQQQQLLQEQKKAEEMLNLETVNETSADDWKPMQYSITSIKSKLATKARWSRHTSSKNTPKAKIQSSSGSVNLTKSVKSTAKHVENTTKLRSSKNSMVEVDSRSMVSSRKRKRSVKRLKQASKLSLGKKFSDHATQKCFNDFDTDNLVELYHNIAAKGSESDESNNPSKAQLSRQKGGGDLVITSPEVPKFEEEVAPKKPVNKIFHTQRILAPINENTLMDDNFNRTECFTTMPRNYELPTIASKMKQVTKSYFQSFNFRSIPFCAAKSTTPSHNIGINIQQVMSIIKTRQPITGISATLAHNISLAAEKLQSRPLSVLVSTLSSKMGYGGASQCPLIRSSLNREQLQEMAKEIPEEPEKEQHENTQAESFSNTETFSRGACGDREESRDTIWSVDPASQRRCTCASQKGVPFQHVLSKYQVSSDTNCVPSRQPQTTKSYVTRKYTKATINPSMMRTQATTNWVKNEATQAVVNKKSDKNCLKGREKSLKTVLQNLHDEFDTLNTKYEQLAKAVKNNEPEANQGPLKELEEMERLLNKKEEEINMVMALYTEVLALKDQVKKLKDRTSQPSIVLTQNSSKTSEYKDPNAALHLTQLLRQIQHYQKRYRAQV